MFITLEGVEGTGKSTQARRLAAEYAARGQRVWLTREPGGTSLAEAIRAVVLHPDATRAALAAAGLLPPAGATDPEPVTAAAELLLMNAARGQLVAAIRHHLATGTVVICDRYADATRAYQGGGRGLDPDQIEAAIAIATGGLEPDLTILLDLAPEIGLARKQQILDPTDRNRLDDEDLAFHRRVRAAYLAQAAQSPARWLVLDATLPPDAVAAAIQAALAPRW